MEFNLKMLNFKALLRGATCLATTLCYELELPDQRCYIVQRFMQLVRNPRVLLAAQQKYCETSCKRDVTLCNG